MRYRCVTEEPAGLAAFSLWVHGGPRCRPPISRMGNKAGYAHALGALAGIRAGEGAGAYVWAEADDDVRALLRAYTDAEALRRIAEIIRGWADEEPRALWERLRAERKARPPKGEEGVAGWIIEAQWSFRRGEPDSGFNKGVATGQAWNADAPETADRCTRLLSSWPPVLVLPTILPASALAEALGTPGDLSDVLCYADPPYSGTTGYTANLSRAEVVRHALERAALGACVMVSESRAVEELIAAGWQAHDIGHTRRGQKRTFAANSGEMVTMNFDPVDRYERVEQVALFG